MNVTSMRILYWTPRVLCILFAVFISLFALDVFEQNRGLGEILLALMIHLIPTGIVLVVLAVSWRWEWVGGVIFLGLAALYCFMSRGRFPLVTYAAIAGPMLLMSLLFFLNWRFRAKLKQPQ